MLPCIRRQKVVKRLKGDKVTVFRCISKESSIKGQEVTEEICAQCPVRKFKKEGPPCQQAQKEAQNPPPVKDPSVTEEMRDIVKGTPLENLSVDGLEADTDEKSPDYPSIPLQLWLYRDALVKWKKAGYPVRTNEEVKEIHEKKCKPCSWYDSDKKRCKGCGCRVTDGGVAVVNKIKMATEHCPREYW